MAPVQSVSFDSPVSYDIAVQGKLNPYLFELVDIDTHRQDFDGENFITSIRVHVKDQAQLSGILNVLYDMRLTILLVESCKNKEAFKS